MSISFTKYINIVSGVGAAANVRRRDLVLRLFTQNTAIPPGAVYEISSLAAVGTLFGTGSVEYARAQAYFAFVSKQITSPRMISFYRMVASAIAAGIWGQALTYVNSSFTAIGANGGLQFNVDVTTNGTLVRTPVTVTGINLSGVTSAANVATAINTRLAASGNTELAGSTVAATTNAAGLTTFALTGTTVGTTNVTTKISIVPGGVANDISTLLGWASTSTVTFPSQVADTAAGVVAKSVAISNNFGSFAYVSTLNLSDQTAVAAWTDAQNNRFMFCTPTDTVNGPTLSAAVIGYSGTAMTALSTTLPNDYAEQCPAEILAASDYTRPGASQNYMFYQFPSRNVVVNDDTTSAAMDNARINYIGQTQTGGQLLSFYQRGILGGGTTAAVDMNVFANEMWLKDDIGATLMGAMLSLPRIPTNDTGRATVISLIQQSIDKAKTNGVISQGSTLNATQQQYITSISGDPNAWRQVASIGYWINVYFTSSVTTDGRTEWAANYVLIYKKDDAIRAVNGSDILI